MPMSNGLRCDYVFRQKVLLLMKGTVQAALVKMLK